MTVMQLCMIRETAPPPIALSQYPWRFGLVKLSFKHALMSKRSVKGLQWLACRILECSKDLQSSEELPASCVFTWGCHSTFFFFQYHAARDFRLCWCCCNIREHVPGISQCCMSARLS